MEQSIGYVVRCCRDYGINPSERLLGYTEKKTRAIIEMHEQFEIERDKFKAFLAEKPFLNGTMLGEYKETQYPECEDLSCEARFENRLFDYSVRVWIEPTKHLD